MIEIVVFGKPQYKRRVRARNAGKFIQTYSDPAQQEAETTIQAIAQQHRPESGPLTQMLTAKIVAYFPIPKSTSQKKKREMKAGVIRPTKKPDVDNIAKIYLDAMNGIIFDDDKQVVDLRVMKFYSETPRVEIRITHGQNGILA